MKLKLTTDYESKKIRWNIAVETKNKIAIGIK